MKHSYLLDPISCSGVRCCKNTRVVPEPVTINWHLNLDVAWLTCGDDVSIHLSPSFHVDVYTIHTYIHFTLQWRHDRCDGVLNHQPHHCLLNRLLRRKSKLRVTGLCAGNSPVTGEFPAQMASNAENASILWRHHEPNVVLSLVITLTSQRTSWRVKSPTAGLFI